MTKTMKKTKGRITRDGATVRRVQVMLDDETVERAKALGDDNLSMGLRIAVREAYMKTLDQLVREYSANAFVLADDGNGYCVTGSSTSCDMDLFDETQARAEAQEEAQIQAFRMERYWMAGLRALTTEAAAEAAVAKLG